LYIIGLVFERAGVVDKAMAIISIVLDHVQELFDSKDDWVRDRIQLLSFRHG